jgi:hypothetical protein
MLRISFDLLSDLLRVRNDADTPLGLTLRTFEVFDMPRYDLTLEDFYLMSMTARPALEAALASTTDEVQKKGSDWRFV